MVDALRTVIDGVPGLDLHPIDRRIGPPDPSWPVSSIAPEEGKKALDKHERSYYFAIYD
jgi:hypothetical protein